MAALVAFITFIAVIKLAHRAALDEELLIAFRADPEHRRLLVRLDGHGLDQLHPAPAAPVPLLVFHGQLLIL
jgi:hypothetical protein